jgi:hypothetical protein
VINRGSRVRGANRAPKLAPEEDHEGPLTFNQIADLYIKRYVKPRGLRTADDIEYRLKPLRVFFGDKELKTIKTADVEDFIADLQKPRRVNRQDNRVLRVASINRALQTLRAVA